MEPKTAQSFITLVEIIQALRTPGTGCPWDLEQNHRSLRPYVVEEAYEVVQAIESEDDAHLCDELGDVLLQVVLHAQVAKDRGAFDINDVIQQVTAKMIRRHPHVFGDVKVEGAHDVVRNWEKIKGEEKKDSSAGSAHPVGDRLASIPNSLPALLRAQRLGEKAARVHFDWGSVAGVLEKVKEELGELQAEIDVEPDLKTITGQPAQVSKAITEDRARGLEHELGDLLFSLCQLARWLGLSAEDSLRNCGSRFISRFKKMEESAQGKLNELTEDKLEELWQAAKRR